MSPWSSKLKSVKSICACKDFEFVDDRSISGSEDHRPLFLNLTSAVAHLPPHLFHAAWRAAGAHFRNSVNKSSDWVKNSGYSSSSTVLNIKSKLDYHWQKYTKTEDNLRNHTEIPPGKCFMMNWRKCGGSNSVTILWLEQPSWTGYSVSV